MILIPESQVHEYEPGTVIVNTDGPDVIFDRDQVEAMAALMDSESITAGVAKALRIVRGGAS